MNTPPPLQFGVEIEAFFVANQCQHGRPLYKYALELADGYPHEPGMISGFHERDKTYSTWQIVHDTSLGDRKGFLKYPLEIISPILTFDDAGVWREHIKNVFQHVGTKCRLIETSDVCGFHVHMSSGDGKLWDITELKSICFAIIYFEEALLALLPKSRQKNEFLGSNYLENDHFCDMNRQQIPREEC